MKYWSLLGDACEITIEPRPIYCDRGNFIAKIDEKFRDDEIDAADCWPRYYFDFEVAKSECIAFLKKRKKYWDWEVWREFEI